MKKLISGHNKNVFLDTDVLISSILSNKSASYWIVHNVENLNIFTNTETLEEFSKVLIRNNLPSKTSFTNRLVIVNQKSKYMDLQEFINDQNDAHILKGTIDSSSEYLITFNKNDYKIDLIRATFNIITLSPGEFLQYLRSLQ